MQEDFHYYATYCAAYMAGFTPEESERIAFSANFVDLCSKTYLAKVNGPKAAATTQLSLEMAAMRTDIPGLQEITGIWASFHFLPYDLYADIKKGSRRYKNKRRMVCGPNGDLVVDTVQQAKGNTLEAIGISMHVLADTWAHRYFAGTPSLVINNTTEDFYELLESGERRKLRFINSLGATDDLEQGIYTRSIYQADENSIMNLGHGRAGHLPDYSFLRYSYLPAWGNYEEIIKDNPSDYLYAFCQMITALKYIHGSSPSFEKEQYDFEAIKPHREEIETILKKRQLIACDDWRVFGEKLSGYTIAPFDRERYSDEYVNASEEEKEETFLGRFSKAALEQKYMVAKKITDSGSYLAGRIKK